MSIERRSKSLPLDTAHTHVTGQSEYIDDRALRRGELYVEVLYSPHARATIKKIDLSEALKHPGIEGGFTAKDLHHNHWGPIFQDQPLMAEKEVRFVGEPVAILASESLEALFEAKKKIRVEYQVLKPILSIDEAKTAGSFIGEKRSIARGNALRVLGEAPHRLEGRVKIKGQDHFYLESQATVVYPLEDGQLEVHSSSQHPTETQHVVAHAVGLPFKDVVCIVRRMGGGFGGKESQAAPFAALAALVAHKLGKPARIILTKDDDMIMTGKRNPFENDYRVGFDDTGKILALDADLYSDGGAYADLSTSIMERAMLHIDNAYFIPNLTVRGQVCRTNFHPHTAFRGFGGPKGVATIELIMEEIAHRLGIDSLDVRKRNCYSPSQKGESDTTHYGQLVENNCLPRLFDELEASSNYRKRREEIKAHNAKALKTGPKGELIPLRGLSMTAVKFGIAFTTRFLNQGNAHVIVHRDGSIQVATGATEMGQGVNARIAELVASELGLPRSQVRVMPTVTDKNANTSPTAASSGTDLNGAAAVRAVKRVKQRLAKVAVTVLKTDPATHARKTAGLGTNTEIEVENEGATENDPTDFYGITFEDGYAFDSKNPSQRIAFTELVNETYLNRVSLSEYAHFKTPHLSFNKLTGKGRAFLYFTQGTAVSEVSLSQVTGEAKVTRVDILMDLGRPINEGLDLGQVIGGFVQGMGWVTTENLFYSKEGKLLSHSPSTYKIPNVQDTPRIFNVKLLENEENHANLKGTKAVGEPPLLLAISTWTAIQDALKNTPESSKVFPKLPIPATQEEILRMLAPGDFIAFENGAHP